MDIKKWKVFLYVANYGNFTKAGEELGYTQSGVTQMMKSLEHEVGFPLFHKSHRGVNLTQQGKQLLPSIRGLMASEEAILQEISFMNGAKKGTLKIGSFTSCAIHWIPKIIREFEKEHSEIVFDILEGHENEIGEWVANHKVDIGFTSYQAYDKVDFIPVYNDPLYAVLPLDHPLAGHETISIQEINSQDFIICAQSFNTDIRRILKKHSVQPNIKYLTSNDYSIISMVEHKLGISILPGLVLRKQQGDFVAIPFEEDIHRVLGIAIHPSHEMSPAMKFFIKYAKNYLLDD